MGPSPQAQDTKFLESVRPPGQHSFILAAGRVPEVDQAIQQIGHWLHRHLGA
ncbi:hypothetical protein WEI85_46405 [Actinomycetes bacterium KLBMP 9797]